MTELTIAAGAARALMELAVSKGASRRVLAERSRIDPEELRDRANRLPFGKYVRLMRAGQELCHDPALALHFGEFVDVSEISFAALIGGASPSWAEIVAVLNRYAPLTVEIDGGEAAGRFALERSGTRLWLVDTRKNANDFPELTESAFARLVCSGRRWLGDRQFVLAVHVTHPEPAYRAEYERIFRVPVVFESDRNALLVDEAVLTYRGPVPSQHVSEILSAHAEVLLQRLESSKSMRGRVESLLLPVLHTGDVGMNAIAGKLALSRQTLFRRLKAEGVTFEEVLDELRLKLAVQLLGEEKLSIKQTAHALGFSEPASFSRAFKRWTGVNPGAYLARFVIGVSARGGAGAPRVAH